VLRAANQSRNTDKELTTESLLLAISQTSFELRLNTFLRKVTFRKRKLHLNRYFKNFLSFYFIFPCFAFQKEPKV
jgi:hypothetical protein